MFRWSWIPQSVLAYNVRLRTFSWGYHWNHCHLLFRFWGPMLSTFHSVSCQWCNKRNTVSLNVPTEHLQTPGHDIFPVPSHCLTLQVGHTGFLPRHHSPISSLLLTPVFCWCDFRGAVIEPVPAPLRTWPSYESEAGDMKPEQQGCTVLPVGLALLPFSICCIVHLWSAQHLPSSYLQ